MIELGGLDAQEKDVAKGFALAQKEINKLIEFQEKIRAEIGKPKAEVMLADPDPELKAAVDGILSRQDGSGSLPADEDGASRMQSLRFEKRPLCALEGNVGRDRKNISPESQRIFFSKKWSTTSFIKIF